MIFKPYLRKAQFYETDQMGIIHHANYIRWFEECRVDFMEQMGFGYNKAVEAGIDFAVLGVSCDYKTMVRFGDTVEIHARVKSITAARLSIAYEIKDSLTKELRTTGETRHCYYNNLKRRPVSLQKELPRLYELLCSVHEG